MYRIVPALAAVGALIATTSRGALLAFLGSLVVAVRSPAAPPRASPRPRSPPC